MSGDRGGCVLLGLGVLALWYCSSPDSPRLSSSTASFDSYEASGEDELEDSVDTEKGGETRAEYEQRQDEIGGRFGTDSGDVCTVSCDGHEAGRQWAERRGITDESECGGRSWSFQEGCETYARGQQPAEDGEAVEE